MERQFSPRTIRRLIGLACAGLVGLVALAGAAVAQNPEGAAETRRAMSYEKVAARLSRQGETTALLRLDIQEGWHVMSAAPGFRFAVPLTVEGPGVRRVAFPEAHALQVQGLDAEVGVYKGAAVIEIGLDPGAARDLTVTLQTCATDVCLPPERAVLPLPRRRP